MYTCIYIYIFMYIYIQTSIHMSNCPDGSNVSELGKLEIMPGIDFKRSLNMFGVVKNGLE